MCHFIISFRGVNLNKIWVAHAFTIQPAFLMHCVTTCMTVAFEQVLISQLIQEWQKPLILSQQWCKHAKDLQVFGKKSFSARSLRNLSDACLAGWLQPCRLCFWSCSICTIFQKYILDAETVFYNQSICQVLERCVQNHHIKCVKWRFFRGRTYLRQLFTYQLSNLVT